MSHNHGCVASVCIHSPRTGDDPSNGPDQRKLALYGSILRQLGHDTSADTPGVS